MDVDKIKADMLAAANAALKADGERVRQKIVTRGHAILFDALESIGATLDEIWHGEWTGPIMFRDPKGNCRLILVEQSDHDGFDAWLKQHPSWTDFDLQEHGREALVRMCGRRINPGDYA